MRFPKIPTRGSRDPAAYDSAGRSVSIGDAEIVPIRGIHYKLPVFGFRIGRLAYLTDMNRIDDRELKRSKEWIRWLSTPCEKNITCRISRWTKRCISVIGCRPVPPT